MTMTENVKSNLNCQKEKTISFPRFSRYDDKNHLYDYVGYFDINGFAIVRKKKANGERFGVINLKGEEVVPPDKYTYVSAFSSIDLAKVQNELGYYGFIDRSGKEVVPAIYKDANFTSKKNMVRVLINGRFEILNLDEKEKSIE